MSFTNNITVATTRITSKTQRRTSHIFFNAIPHYFFMSFYVHRLVVIHAISLWPCHMVTTFKQALFPLVCKSSQDAFSFFEHQVLPHDYDNSNQMPVYSYFSCFANNNPYPLFFCSICDIPCTILHCNDNRWCQHSISNIPYMQVSYVFCAFASTL